MSLVSCKSLVFDENIGMLVLNENICEVEFQSIYGDTIKILDRSESNRVISDMKEFIKLYELSVSKKERSLI